MQLNLVYFAWVRERIGLDGESRTLPGVVTVTDVLEALRDLGAGYGHAFEQPERLRFALDQDFVGADAAVHEGAELAIFPPVTGG